MCGVVGQAFQGLRWVLGWERVLVEQVGKPDRSA